MIELDNIDRKIIRELQVDANVSAAKVGKILGMSQPAMWRRMKRLKELGVFRGQRLELNNKALGFDTTVFVGVKLTAKGPTSFKDFERAVTAIPEVQTVEQLIGEYDYRLRVITRDIVDFERVLRRRIMVLPGIASVDANVLLSEERFQGPIG